MKIIILSAALAMICFYTQSQNLIGYKEKEIVKYMKDNRRDMNYNNVVNTKFSYLKYSDNLETQTMLFFLNPDSVCRSIRIICDASMKYQQVKELDSKYQRTGDYKWTDEHNGKVYKIELMEGKWSCVISIETEK